MNELEIKIAQLEKDRAKLLKENRLNNIDFIKRLVKFIENPKYSKDDQSPHFLSEGEMLDIIVDQLKKLTTIRHRLNNPKL